MKLKSATPTEWEQRNGRELRGDPVAEYRREEQRLKNTQSPLLTMDNPLRVANKSLQMERARQFLQSLLIPRGQLGTNRHILTLFFRFFHKFHFSNYIGYIRTCSRSARPHYRTLPHLSATCPLVPLASAAPDLPLHHHHTNSPISQRLSSAAPGRFFRIRRSSPTAHSTRRYSNRANCARKTADAAADSVAR